jgi:predicted kinase
MKLAVFSGLPGTGKTTLAERIGREMAIPVFALDSLLGAMIPDKILTNETAADVGYSLLTTLARRQLMLGQSAILDSVVGLTPQRESWRQMAAEFGADYYAIETICSDETLRRQRIEGRQRGIPGWHELTWANVERSRANYQAWEGERLVLDAVASLEDNLEAVRQYLGETNAS